MQISPKELFLRIAVMAVLILVSYPVISDLSVFYKVTPLEAYAWIIGGCLLVAGVTRGYKALRNKD